jgi:hypothetical protein
MASSALRKDVGPKNGILSIWNINQKQKKCNWQTFSALTVFAKEKLCTIINCSILLISPLLDQNSAIKYYWGHSAFRFVISKEICILDRGLYWFSSEQNLFARTAVLLILASSSSSSSSSLARQSFVCPGLPQSCSPFFSIWRYTPPIFYAQGSNILPHTFFPSHSWSSHFPISFGISIKYFLNRSILACTNYVSSPFNPFHLYKSNNVWFIKQFVYHDYL